jgi:hypothetical protein
MANFDIDRLTLDLPGATEEEGRRIALDIVVALGAAGGLPATGDYPSLRVAVPAIAGERPEELAARIVAAALRELRHGSG